MLYGMLVQIATVIGSHFSLGGKRLADDDDDEDVADEGDATDDAADVSMMKLDATGCGTMAINSNNDASSRWWQVFGRRRLSTVDVHFLGIIVWPLSVWCLSGISWTLGTIF